MAPTSESSQMRSQGHRPEIMKALAGRRSERPDFAADESSATRLLVLCREDVAQLFERLDNPATHCISLLPQRGTGDQLVGVSALPNPVPRCNRYDRPVPDAAFLLCPHVVV
jgi:hypothetical protein